MDTINNTESKFTIPQSKDYLSFHTSCELQSMRRSLVQQISEINMDIKFSNDNSYIDSLKTIRQLNDDIKQIDYVLLQRL